MHALRGVDLDLPAGRFTAIMGPSGSGKSTLMHCLAGLDQPTAGQVTVAGTSLESLDDDALTVFRREHLGFVFQSFNLLPMLTAGQNILLPAGARRPPGRPRQVRRAGAARSTWPTGWATGRPSSPAASSSGSPSPAPLIAEPDLVFADEPTGNLDSESSAEVLDHLRRSVRELGQTVVMVTHELDAAAYADDVLVIADGEIRAHLTDPTADELVATLRGDR